MRGTRRGTVVPRSPPARRAMAFTCTSSAPGLCLIDARQRAARQLRLRDAAAPMRHPVCASGGERVWAQLARGGRTYGMLDIWCFSTDHAVFVCTIYSTAGHGWYSADSLRPFTCRRPSRTLAGIPRPLCWPRQFNVNATLRCLSSDPRAGHRRRHGQMERGSLQPQQCSLRQWLCYMAQHSCS